MFGDQLKLKDEFNVQLGCGHVQLLSAIAAGQFQGATKVLCPDCNNWIGVSDGNQGRVEEKIG